MRPDSKAPYPLLATAHSQDRVNLVSGFFPTAPCLLVYPTYCGSPIPPGIEEYAILLMPQTTPKSLSYGFHIFNCDLAAGQTPDRNHFVVMILSIYQDIWVAVRGVGLEIGKGYLYFLRAALTEDK